MHFSEPVYRNPYWPTWPLIQITQGCTHNSCKFCTMYRDVPFRMQPMEWIEEDLRELQASDPHAKTIQLLSANPLALSYDRLMPRLELIKKYLPELEHIYAATRVTDIKNKTVEQLRKLKESGVNEISLGVESGDDWTLKRINKGYTSQDILEQCHKLEEAGIAYWMTFLNGVAGREHSHEHAVNSALIFNQCRPMLVGSGGLTLFPGTPLLEEAERGEFTPLDERELMQELKTFLELLTCDCEVNTHHTSSLRVLTGPFLSRKQQILDALQEAIDHADIDAMTRRRQQKRGL
ncbi:MAG: radical SAM protein [Bacteroidales bacterium]|nr:radical SAM protein [Bacteroidales bacterium]